MNEWSHSQKQHLMICLMEEAGEVIQAVSKILRFGPEDHYPEHPEVLNKEQLEIELCDFVAVMEMIGATGLIDIGAAKGTARIGQKKVKVRKYMEYSAKLLDGR